MTALEEYIHTSFGIPTTEIQSITKFFKLTFLKKGDFFIQENSHANKLAFVNSGILREFITTDDKEITKWISSTGQFSVDLASFIFEQPARWNIQALTDCELYVIDCEDYKKIGLQIPTWHSLEKHFITKCFIVLENRVVQFLSMSAEDRYKQLFDYNKDLFNQVPLNYLASMLGMAPETLSRLRKKNSESKS